MPFSSTKFLLSWERCYLPGVAYSSFSKFRNGKQQEGLLKNKWLPHPPTPPTPPPQRFCFSRSGMGLGIFISKKFPGDAEAVASGTPLWESLASMLPCCGKKDSGILLELGESEMQVPRWFHTIKELIVSLCKQCFLRIFLIKLGSYR